ncbi:GNAT family N-acetyltransferase [Nonomuraea sp. NPDC049421]|uniref:GNAT family N-acetyltransferase n=1 Tax=Nonomuraea sp. NPDC049421 TaxID=3155275 RepID=UPI003412061E
MRIQPIDPEQPGGLIEGLHEAYVTAEAASGDDRGPEPTLAWFSHLIRRGGAGQRYEAWVATDGGKVAGGYGLELYETDNRHIGWLFPLAVRPESQGRGLGTALFAHALDRMRANGRTLLLTETITTGTAARFAAARGMTVAMNEARRTLDLRAADWDALRRMRPEVPGYHLEQWIGPAGPELLPDLAVLMDGMNDAPRDPGVEDQVHSVERLRQREESIPLTARTSYTTIARRTSDGAPAGYTRILLDTARDNGWGHQTDTTVLREHRGHRLGLLLKVANLLWLREHEPHLDRIITWNAVSNAHMLAINEAMGFELFDEWHEWRLPL